MCRTYLTQCVETKDTLPSVGTQDSTANVHHNERVVVVVVGVGDKTTYIECQIYHDDVDYMAQRRLFSMS